MNLLRGTPLQPSEGPHQANRALPFFNDVRNELLEQLTLEAESTPTTALYGATLATVRLSVARSPLMARPPSLRQRVPLRALPSPPPLGLLVWLPSPTRVAVPARAAMGAEPPPAVGPLVAATARRGCRSTTPGPRSSPCGRTWPQVPPCRIHLSRLSWRCHPTACLRQLRLYPCSHLQGPLPRHAGPRWLEGGTRPPLSSPSAPWR